jgi:hypothetical protein
MNGILPWWKLGSCGGGSPPPFILTKKLKKHPNKYRTPYKYAMQQYILEKHIKINHQEQMLLMFCTHFAPYLLAHIFLKDY